MGTCLIVFFVKQRSELAARAEREAQGKAARLQGGSFAVGYISQRRERKSRG